jgi:hypothetical protein
VRPVNSEDQTSVYPRFAYKNVQQLDERCLLLVQSSDSVYIYIQLGIQNVLHVKQKHLFSVSSRYVMSIYVHALPCIEISAF